jgi:hypothetical protein
MKKIVIFLYILLTLSSCVHKTKLLPLIIDTDLKEFSDKWIADSLGENGFRASHYSFDQNAKSWKIGEYDLKGRNKEEIIKVLGKSTEQGLGKEDGLLIMVYIVEKCKTLPNKFLILYFDKENKLDVIIFEN